jgi:hypothetical protein
VAAVVVCGGTDGDALYLQHADGPPELLERLPSRITRTQCCVLFQLLLQKVDVQGKLSPGQAKEKGGSKYTLSPLVVVALVPRLADGHRNGGSGDGGGQRVP